MPSKVIYGNDYNHEVDLGLDIAAYTYRFLVEGDSWMDRSSVINGSLPWALADRFDQAGETALFINVSHAGDTLQQIEGKKNGEFGDWLKAFNWPFHGVLLSAGGNDFIDWARDPDPGKGILNDMAGAPTAATVDDCLNLDQMQKLVNQVLHPCFDRLDDKIRDKQKSTLVFLNAYDAPMPRNAPATPKGRTWLCESFKKNHVPESLWVALAEALFADVESTVQGWTVGRNKTFAVPTRGTLKKAPWGTSGQQGDWQNEIHPSPQGWAKLANVWYATMRPLLP